MAASVNPAGLSTTQPVHHSTSDLDSVDGHYSMTSGGDVNLTVISDKTTYDMSTVGDDRSKLRVRIINETNNIDEIRDIFVSLKATLAELQFEVERTLEIKAEHQLNFKFDDLEMTSFECKLAEYGINKDSILTIHLPDDSDYTPSPTETAENTEPSENIQFKNEHSKILQETESVAAAFVISASVGWLAEAMILTLYISFAKTFADANNADITIMITCQSIGQIIGILSSSYAADKYGFDTLTIVTSTMLLISVIIQSLSFSISPFIIGIFLKGLAMDDIEVLSCGFYGKLLPYDSSTKYTAYHYAFTTFSLNVGYLLGGLITMYSEYRTAFFVATAIILCRWIHVLFAIRDRQKNLISKQMSFLKYYKLLKQRDELVENECFPLCLDGMKEDTSSIKKIECKFDTSGTPDKMKNAESVDVKAESPNGVIQRQGTMFWMELLLNLILFGAVYGTDFLPDQFLIPYMNESEFFADVPNLWILSMFMVLNIVFIIVSFAIPSFIEDLSLMKLYLLAVPLSVFMMILFFIMYPTVHRSKLYLFWIYMAVDGAARAVLGLAVEYTVLALQPANHTGKVSALRTLLRMGLAAVAATFTAILWEQNNDIWYWYSQALLFALSLLCALLLIAMRLTYA